MNEHQMALSQPIASLLQLENPILSSALTAQHQVLQGWFVGEPSMNGLGIAKQAFDDAVREFSAEVSTEECASWLRGSNTIFDVEQAVNAAKQKYESKSPKSRARAWLASCSSRLMYYSTIMDTLAQHHPEYVSLAWGAIKFLFIAVLNHEELLTEIAKAVSKIANVLPRADLCSNLYPTQRMGVVVAQLYAKVLRFVRDAIKWYKKGKLSHSMSAVFKPYSLGFKAIVEEISEASRRVDQEASAASKAEIRELHIKVHHLTQITTAHFSRYNFATANVANQLELQTGMLRQDQMARITSLPLLTELPDAGEYLQFCRSIKTRRRTQWLIEPAEITKLQEWHESPVASSVLIAHCQGLYDVSRDFFVELLDMLREGGVPAIWGVSDTASDEDVTLIGLLLSLAVQALILNLNAVNECAISSYHFQQVSTLDQGLKLLGRCLSGLSKLYIIIDRAVVNTAVKYDERLGSDFVRKLLYMLVDRLESGVKFVVVDGGLDDSSLIEQDDVEETHIFVVGQSPSSASKRRSGGRGFKRYSSHVAPFGRSSTIFTSHESAG